jgi:opacity protein-like surface antigen
MRAIVILSTILLLAAGASAQVPSSPIKFYGGIGFSNPSDPISFSDSYDKTYHAMVGIGFNIMPKIELMPKLEYHSFSSDIRSLKDGKMKATMFGVDGKFTLSLPAFPFAPYALGGVGLAAVKQDDFNDAMDAIVDVPSLKNQTQFYYDYGFGLEWKLMPAISAFGQMQWVKINTEDERETIDFEGMSLGGPYDEMNFWAFTVGIKVL